MLIYTFKKFEYIIPPNIQKSERAKNIFIESMNPVQIEYNQLVDTLCNEELDNLIKEYLIHKKNPES